MTRLLPVLALSAVFRTGIAAPLDSRQTSSQITYVNLASNTGTSVHRASGTSCLVEPIGLLRPILTRDSGKRSSVWRPRRTGPNSSFILHW